MDASTTSASTAPAKGLTERLREVIDELDTLLKSAVASGDRSVEAARLELSHRLRRLRLQLDELQAETAYRARRAVRAADAAVQDHPYRAVGIGAIAGLVVGWLLARPSPSTSD